MMAVPRRPERAPDEEADAPLDPIDAADLASGLANGSSESTTTTALATVGPLVDPDPGLYGVLGLDPSVSDEEIQTAYRRQAARLQGGGGRNQALLRQLNVAYEVLGQRVRRDEYDRNRLAQLLAPSAPTPIQAASKTPVRITRRRRPRHAVQPQYAGFSYVLVVLFVVGLAAAAGGLLILPRLSFNLSALNALQSVMPLPSSTRRPVDVTVTPLATAAPTATVQPAAAARFVGSNVSVSNPAPAQNSMESVFVKVRHDGQPAAEADVWAIVKYTTTEERWPATGTQKTDAAGAATISFNIGRAVPEHPVPVEVFAQVGGQQYSWSTTFTPH